LPSLDPWPDLRHVRYVVLSARPPGNTTADLPLGARLLRNGIVGASIAGSIAVQATGHALAGLLLGGALGAVTGLLLRGRTPAKGFALVPWGVLVDDSDHLVAIRWSGVRALDVRYRASREGTVQTRVEVDSIRGAFVGWASDAVDFGALAGNLHDVAAASARPIAVDFDSDTAAQDGEPFVERVLDSARRVVHLEGDTRLGLPARSYREARSVSVDGSQTARALRALGGGANGVGDPWGLIAAIAGELRLTEFSPELARLANAPHPGVAALARAAMGRFRAVLGDRAEDDTFDTRDTDDGEALSWFVQPDELERLRAWRDA